MSESACRASASFSSSSSRSDSSARTLSLPAPAWSPTRFSPTLPIRFSISTLLAMPRLPQLARLAREIPDVVEVIHVDRLLQLARHEQDRLARLLLVVEHDRPVGLDALDRLRELVRPLVRRQHLPLAVVGEPDVRPRADRRQHRRLVGVHVEPLDPVRPELLQRPGDLSVSEHPTAVHVGRRQGGPRMALEVGPRWVPAVRLVCEAGPSWRRRERLRAARGPLNGP